MLKKNKLKVIISSVIVLIPMLFGIIMWNDLPDIMTTHFGADASADGFSTKAFTVFGISAIFLALHIFTLLVTSFDKKQKEQSPKALSIIFWIIPVISVFVNVIIYSVALGREVNLQMLIPLLLGVSFIFMGNYMPKIKQNSTLGIKVSWALRNEENWNKTHRFGGKLMVAGGFVMLLSALLPLEVSAIVFVCVIAAYVIVPTVYSYLIYRQHKKEGIEYAAATKEEKTAFKIVTVVVAIAVIVITVVMFTGDIEVDCGETAFKINATYGTDIEVDYSEIDAVEYRKNFDIGLKANGFNSAKLLTGVFRNDEIGSYTLYSYMGAEEFVVITSEGKKLVIGMNSAGRTREIYNMISDKTK